MKLSMVLSFAFVGIGFSARADQFHYSNALVGDRAMGLGGAYAGIADDATGVVYNPAGMAFSLSNDISGSVSAWPFKEVEYLETIGDKSFTEKSQGKFQPFFGALQKLDHIYPGLVFGFGIWTSDAELKDQDDLITADYIPRFHRTVNFRGATDYVGAAIARRFGSNFAIGFGINYVTAEELLQEYQDALTVAAIDPAVYYQILTQNMRQLLDVTVIEPVLGLQFVLGKLSLGLMIKTPFIFSQSYENTIENHVVFVDGDRNVIANEQGQYRITRQTPNLDSDNPIGSWPAEYRFGAAYFANTSLVLTSDLSYRTAAEGNVSFYDRLGVLNVSAGAEYYVTSSNPLRLGFFTNNDARPDVVEGKANQRDHIDYLGFSMFLGFMQPTSSLSVGGIYQMGSGKAQKISNSAKIQDVVARFYTVAFSATQNL